MAILVGNIFFLSQISVIAAVVMVVVVVVSGVFLCVLLEYKRCHEQK